MRGDADIGARVAAILYTLIIAAIVWFTFAFGGFNANQAQMGESLVFGAIALSPIPVCILCFRRG